MPTHIISIQRKSGAPNENIEAGIDNRSNYSSDHRGQGQSFDGRSKVLKMNEDSDGEKNSKTCDIFISDIECQKQPSDDTTIHNHFPSNSSFSYSRESSSSEKEGGINSNHRPTSCRTTLYYEDRASHITSKSGALFCLRVVVC